MDLAETVNWTRLEETSSGRERPIIFSGAMVRAILDGRKTMTRRVAGDQIKSHSDGSKRRIFILDKEHEAANERLAKRLPHPCDRVACPYGVPGDRLWVREAAYIAPSNFNDPSDTDIPDDIGRPRIVDYAATMDADSVRCANEYGVKVSPSIHMPRWASRITLVVESVRVERVQEITEADARAEGVERHIDDGATYYGPYGSGHASAVVAFSELWDSINAKRGFGWDTNPWVWVIQFKRFQQERGNA